LAQGELLLASARETLAELNAQIERSAELQAGE
jgi:hypothetical protein